MDAADYPFACEMLFAGAWCVLLALACFAGIRRLKNVLCVLMVGAMFLAFKFAGNENFLWFYAAFVFAFGCVIVATWLAKRR